MKLEYNRYRYIGFRIHGMKVAVPTDAIYPDFTVGRVSRLTDAPTDYTNIHAPQ